MENQTYYQQVKTLVAPRLKHYRDDLTKHDNSMLRGYTGEFMHASRDSGTDLTRFEILYSFDDFGTALKSFEYNLAFVMRSGNDLFLHGHNGRVKKK